MSHLTEWQRYEISALLQAGISRKEICTLTGRDKSVLSRELRRNRDLRTGKYNPDLAQRKYRKRMHEKPKHIRFTQSVKERFISDLNNDWSPEQIEGRAKLDGVEMVSHERIYAFVWADKKQGGTLYKHLRNRGEKYSKRGSYKSSRGIVKNRVSIDERPEIVNEKVRFGDLEIDTIIGKNHAGAIFTATDRVSMKEWIIKLPQGKNALGLVKKAAEKLFPVRTLLHTLTADNGKEFAEHELLAKILGVKIKQQTKKKIGIFDTK